MKFFLGTAEPAHLGRTDVPLFISRRRLARRKSLPRALGEWALDSGGFSELSMFGQWLTPPAQYVAEVRRYRDEIGGLQWAAAQDWMCEPFIRMRTGDLSVSEHQTRTTANYLDLLDRAPELPWVPVLQGWDLADYARHAEMYARAGVNLAALPVVGLGSVCRRQGTGEILEIAREFHGSGIRLHGFGVKINGLRGGLAELLTSSDSMAWSYAGRRRGSLVTCNHQCSASHCLPFALSWRKQVLKSISAGKRNFQPTLF